MQHLKSLGCCLPGFKNFVFARNSTFLSPFELHLAAKPLDANPLQLLLDNRAVKNNPRQPKREGRGRDQLGLFFPALPAIYTFFSSIESFGLGIATDLNG
jgi:hypothetical protein